MDGTTRIRLRLDDVVDRAIYLYGLHEYRAARAFCRLLHEGAVVVDAGAHVGQYTLLAARRVGPGGKVYAFEPLPDTRRRLRENVALNDFNNVAVVGAALSDRDGTTRIAAGELGNTGSAALVDEGGIEVECRRLDTVVPERVDVLKLDVEGYEAEVLAGAERTLAASRPAVLFEVNDDRASELLRGLGYRLYSLGEDGALVDLPAGVDPRTLAEPWYAPNLVALPGE